MIRSISLKKFKSFNKLDSINLAPLTVVMGRNSSGKSSVLHSLLLLKQTIESRHKESAIELDGKYLHYSNLNEIAHGLPYAKNAKIDFDILTDQGRVKIGIKNSLKNDKLQPAVNYIKIGNGRNAINIGDDFNAEKFKTLLMKEDQFLRDFLIKIKDESSVKFSFDHFLPERIEVEYWRGKSAHTSGKAESIIFPIGVIRSIGDAVDNLRRSIEGIRYLSPVRAAPQRAYVHYANDAFELNEDGSNSAHILWAKRGEKVVWKGEKFLLSEAINKCISCIGLEQEVTPSRTGKMIYQIKVGIGKNKKVTIADVGFGYSQVIPIILMGLLNGSNNLMLIEQPEIHLHPSSSANLADLFLGFVEDGKNFIVETHSQDFINRLRLRVIQNPEIKNKINIVFVDTDAHGTATAKQFNINEDGSFPEWPSGFIDESENGARALIKARFNRS